MLNTQLEQKKLRLNLAEDTLINTKNQVLMKTVSTLDALSPLKVLSRGYAFVEDEKGDLVSSAKQTSIGTTISVSFHDGTILATVSQVEEKTL